MAKKQNMTLTDLFGVPFVIERQHRALHFYPPNVLFFEQLMRRYNLSVSHIEARLNDGDALDARIQVATTIFQMMHVSLDMARPDDAWTLDRVADLTQRDPGLIPDFLDAFRTYMPQDAQGKVKNPNPRQKARGAEPEDWGYLIGLSFTSQFTLAELKLMSLRGLGYVAETTADLHARMRGAGPL